MDQTKLFQLRTALLWESAYGCITTRRLIIQWSQKILIIDIIISWKLLWDQRPQTIRILHEWNTETQHFQSKRVLVPELLTCSREDRLSNRLIQITRIDQTLPILIQSRPFLLTWSYRKFNLLYKKNFLSLIHEHFTYHQYCSTRNCKPLCLNSDQTARWLMLVLRFKGWSSERTQNDIHQLFGPWEIWT